MSIKRVFAWSGLIAVVVCAAVEAAQDFTFIFGSKPSVGTYQTITPLLPAIPPGTSNSVLCPVPTGINDYAIGTSPPRNFFLTFGGQNMGNVTNTITLGFGANNDKSTNYAAVGSWAVSFTNTGYIVYPLPISSALTNGLNGSWKLLYLTSIVSTITGASNANGWFSNLEFTANGR
jgi:hypothetical protein